MKAYKGGKFSSGKSNVDPNLLKVMKMHEKPEERLLPMNQHHNQAK